MTAFIPDPDFVGRNGDMNGARGLSALEWETSSSLLGVGMQQSPPRYLAGFVWGGCFIFGAVDDDHGRH